MPKGAEVLIPLTICAVGFIFPPVLWGFGGLVTTSFILGDIYNKYKYTPEYFQKLRDEELEKEKVEKEFQKSCDYIEFLQDPDNRCEKCYKLTTIYIDKNGIWSCEKC